MSFEALDLDQHLLTAIAKMGHTRPTSIQTLAIPPAMDEQDIMASAPTGTGKTLAFLLPAVQRLIDFPRRRGGSARILVLTPTRELAVQISEVAQQLVTGTDLVVGNIIGGISYQVQEQVITDSVDIVIATPGRLMEYIDSEAFDCREVETLILDEADRMLDMGFIQVMDRIAGETRWRKHTSLFSATLEGKGLREFSRDVLKNPVQLTAEVSRRESGKILQWVHLADSSEHKLKLLAAILQQQVKEDEQQQKVIVFVKTRDRLAELVAQLAELKISCSYLRGEMDQEKRNLALAQFKEGKVNILIATDVAARGIDVPDITHVINYDMPRSADIYVHRIGRTARGGKKGTAISLVAAHDVDMLAKVERYTDQKLKRRVIKSLRPTHKEAQLSQQKSKKPVSKKGKERLDELKKQQKAKRLKKKEDMGKQRHRNVKAKGKPSWAGQGKKEDKTPE
ncbi:ATP-dependent RNA helicase SrmB [Psychromonas antarctica]|uniref:ATP-dependent RNA helicase SrmB n=1 Tax=Psychromonas antarctica TaxID=67573 RepID=UPI001EE7ABE8|nr:ATP-dependent RNA helicase SrmB [Psychromonas antarctica]MCG6200765.1 ATP-dependent RNA helicase SrmB [Psychromonas antarctica]